MTSSNDQNITFITLIFLFICCVLASGAFPNFFYTIINCPIAKTSIWFVLLPVNRLLSSHFLIMQSQPSAVRMWKKDLNENSQTDDFIMKMRLGAAVTQLINQYTNLNKTFEASFISTCPSFLSTNKCCKKKLNILLQAEKRSRKSIHVFFLYIYSFYQV